jgi:hypothetical protein
MDPSASGKLHSRDERYEVAQVAYERKKEEQRAKNEARGVG